MVSEISTGEQVEALLSHLENPNEFNRPTPVPTLSYDECNYRDDGGYWLGGVWAPTNYMIVRGLTRYNKHKAAKNIAEKYLDALYKVWKNFKPHTLWECYSPENEEPALNEHGKLCRKDFVGWTGLGPISMLIENILGLEVDYPAGKIIWTSDILEEHGIDNMRFGKHKISLRAGKRKSINEKPEIWTDAPCNIDIDFRNP
jgi:glycogen debranching enzyme